MKKIYLLFISTLCVVTLYSQDQISNIWQNSLQMADLSIEKLQSVCPNFPDIDALEAVELRSALKTWEDKYPSEVTAFWNLEEIKSINPSAFYLGLELYEYNDYRNSLIQWVRESKISDNRLMSLAPNFPLNASPEEADAEIQKWIYLYGHEYERLINDRQMTALNPYYTDYQDVVILPKFISALVSEEQPVYVDTKSPAEDQLRYELQMQNWYFVFNPEQFSSVYGFEPQFPDWFDAELFRSQVIERIIVNQDAEERGLTDPNEETR